MSLRGWGTVTIPDLLEWENWWCEPLMRASVHPSASSLLITSALFTVVIIPTGFRIGYLTT
jgi:hypothetical protein